MNLAYVFAASAGSFALARLFRLIGIALCGVGHGGGGPLGTKLIIGSIILYVVAFLAAVTSVVTTWRTTRKWFPVAALCFAVLLSILAELRDVSHMF